jgi:ornithine cyclodeaminase
MTMLLSGANLRELLDIESCLDALDRGFRAASTTIRPQRMRTDLPGPGTATALLPGLVDDIPAYTVKVNAKFPGARPALRGVVCLHDLADGELLALLDSATITAWRTGLAAALGTHRLARTDSRRVAVIGAGAQSELVVRGLAALRGPSELVVYDVDRPRAEDFAARHGSHDVVDDVDTAVDRADIIVCATWSRTAFIDERHLRPGVHVTSLGADEPGKIELAASVLRRARVIVDDISLSVAMGALGNAGLTQRDAAGSLADVLTGQIPGRRSADEITVLAPVGLPWQDLALAWLAYRKAVDPSTFSF